MRGPLSLHSSPKIANFLSTHLSVEKKKIEKTKMQLKSIDRIELPAAADMHVHLRQGELMNLVVPTLAKGGVDTAFVYEFPIFQKFN